MRKLALLITLTVMSALFLGTVGAPAASACSVASGLVYTPRGVSNLDNAYKVSGCSPNVTRIIFSSSYIEDVSTGGPFHANTRRGWLYQGHVGCGPPICGYDTTAALAASHGVWDYQTCWYAGASHVLKNHLYWYYRLSNNVLSAQQHYISPPYVFAC